MSTKRKVADQSIFENSNGFLTQDEIRKRLLGKSRQYVVEQIKRFKNSNLASFFTKEDLEEIVEEIILEISSRVEKYQLNPQDPKAVNPRGMYQYFTKSFQNHCQKLYEKYAKTDQRAGVTTVSSDEALAVASARNLVYPENQHVLNDEIKHVLNKLKEIDQKNNITIKHQYASIGKVPKPSVLSHSSIIIEKLFEGYKPKDLAKLLKLTATEFSQHKKQAFLTAKEHFESDIQELSAHFDATVDYRFYYSEVKKRLKKEKRIENTNHINENYYILENPINNSEYTQIKLCARFDYMIGDDISKDFKGEIHELLNKKVLNKDLSNEKEELNQNLKYSDTVQKKVKNIKKNMMKKLEIEKEKMLMNINIA